MILRLPVMCRVAAADRRRAVLVLKWETRALLRGRPARRVLAGGVAGWALSAALAVCLGYLGRFGEPPVASAFAAVAGRAALSLSLLGPMVITFAAAFLIAPVVLGEGHPAHTYRALLATPAAPNSVGCGRWGAVLAFATALGGGAHLLSLASSLLVTCHGAPATGFRSAVGQGTMAVVCLPATALAAAIFGRAFADRTSRRR